MRHVRRAGIRPATGALARLRSATTSQGSVAPWIPPSAPAAPAYGRAGTAIRTGPELPAPDRGAEPCLGGLGHPAAGSQRGREKSARLLRSLSASQSTGTAPREGREIAHLVPFMVTHPEAPLWIFGHARWLTEAQCVRRSAAAWMSAERASETAQGEKPAPAHRLPADCLSREAGNVSRPFRRHPMVFWKICFAHNQSLIAHQRVD